jgi:uncharacterized membrane protein
MTTLLQSTTAPESCAQQIGRVALGSAMVFAGIGHLTFARQEFRAQVPRFVPRVTKRSVDDIVLASGVVEIALGGSLIVLRSRRAAVGLFLALFFVAILPGNLAQWRHHRDGFGLNSDRARTIRLVFQPVLVAWALWSTGAWSELRRSA